MLVLKVVLGLCLAISSLATESSSIKDLPNDQVSMGVKMDLVLDMLYRQEEEIILLKETVRRQDAQIAHLGRSMEKSKKSDEIFVKNESKAAAFRSCEEIRLADASSESGDYWIDPDGMASGDPPISVYCDMVTGTTSITHDSMTQIGADHCFDPGCYSRSIAYNATMRQMVALTQLSVSCRQYFRFDCFAVPLESNGVAQAWWTDKNGDAQFYWAGDNDTVHTCQCGIEGSCIDPALSCNCDTSAAANLFDQGYITKKESLPVTKLNFGRTLAPSSFGRHTLGQLECTGRAILDRMPESCQDLWVSGHTLSGFYDVKGDTEIRSVYCDFNKIPGDPGFETSVGSMDVKSSPVFFHVQRNSNFISNGSSIPFQVERVNVGGGMDITTGIFTAPKSGIYFFSFTGLKSLRSDPMHIVMLHNSAHTSTAYAPNVGDRVRVHVYYGELYDNEGLYTNFIGMLLKEEISL